MSQKILVIEDEEIMSSMLKDNLEMLGFEVIVAESGMEGLRKAEIFCPELITLDIMMPGLDGITVLEKLKLNNKTKDIPVILMSVAGGKERIGLKLGAVAFFKKPFDFERLNSKIQSITKRKSVLVVDDNPEILKLIKLKLNNLGYVTECADREEAVLEKIKQNKPDVILMDVVLSRASGFDLINKLKSREETSGIPIIAFSGFVSDEVPAREIVGVEKFINRDFTIEELASEVKNFVNGDSD